MPSVTSEAAVYSSVKVKEIKQQSRQIAKEYLLKFFEDKEYCGGGKIPTMLLLTDRNISRIQNTGIDEGMDRAYDALERCEVEASTKAVQPEVDLVLRVMRDCRRLSIPQPYVAGLLLIYLELCTGVDLSDD